MKKIVLAAAAVLLSIGIAQAQETGWSVTGSAGRVNQSAFAITPSGQSSGWTADDSSQTWALTAAYRFVPNWGAEVGYRDFGNQDMRNPNAVTFASTKGKAWTYGGLYVHPLAANVEVLARAGGYKWNMDITSSSSNYSYSGTRAYFGAGVLWKLSSPLGVGLNWTRFVTSTDGIDILEASVQYRF